MSYDLGIDVGTSYTAAAVRGDDGVVTVVGLGPIADSIPTVLYLDEDGSMVAGDAANRRALLDAAGASREFKRRLGDPTPSILRGAPFSAEALIARMLRHVVDRVVDRQRDEPDRIAVSHPANWGPYKMEIFGQALRMAELDDAILVTEPAAAAASYAAEARVAMGSTFAVYDLGGGTFDAAVLRKSDAGFELVGDPVGLEHVGGADFDQAVLDFVRSSLESDWQVDPDDPAHLTAMSHLRRSCMEAKELLSSETEVTIPVLLPGVDESVQLTRSEFEARIRPAVDTSIDALEQAISRSGVAQSDLSAVLLVGGSSRIPLVAELLGERYGSLVAVDIDPVHAVAIGAALTAAGALDAPASAAEAPSPVAEPSVAPPVSPPATPPVTPSAGSSAAPPPRLGEAPPPRLGSAEPVDPLQPAVPSQADIPAATQPPTVPVAPPSEPVVAEPPPRDPEPVPAAPVEAPPQSPPAEPVPAVAAAAVTHPDPQPAPTGSGPESDRDNSKLLLLLGIPILLLLIGGAVFALTRSGDDSATIDATAEGEGDGDAATADDSGGSEDTGSGESAAPVEPALSAPADGMLEVPAGTYPLGLDQPEPNSSETVSRTTEVESFYIDGLEVTNAEYKAFVDQTGALPPVGWRAGRYPEELAAHPVQGVSHEWATAYCTAVSKRLPTEEEWEVAARGAEGFIWPWGDDAAAVELPSEGTYEVGSVSGNVSPFGAFDMTGNAWEWVGDSYDPRVTSDLRVLRGGQNGFLRETVTRLPVDPVRSSALRTAGFRCAADGVDASATVGTFVAYEMPTRPNEPEVVALPEGVQVFDDFTDSTSGWTELAIDGEFRRGYHPNEYLHLETRSEFKEALALGPWKSNPDQGFALRTSAFVEPNLTEDAGTFAHGLAFKFDDEGKGLVFVVDERTSVWQLCSREITGDGLFGQEGVAYEVIEQSSRSIPAEVTLEVVALGNDEYQFKIDGSVVHTRTIPGFEGTATGLILLSYAGSEQAHVHFEEFQVNDVS